MEAKHIHILILVVLCSALEIQAGVITDESYFGPSAKLIDFDHFPSGSVSEFSRIDDVQFASESTPGLFQTADPADTNNRFNRRFKASVGVSGGGTPVTGNYAYGYYPMNWDVSDMRIDFDTPQQAFGFYAIDNDFSTVRVSAYSQDGSLLEVMHFNQVTEGGSAFGGIYQNLPTIKYFIIDGESGQAMDSTFIDNLYYQIPEPSCLVLLSLGALASLRRRR